MSNLACDVPMPIGIGNGHIYWILRPGKKNPFYRPKLGHLTQPKFPNET